MPNQPQILTTRAEQLNDLPANAVGSMDPARDSLRVKNEERSTSSSLPNSLKKTAGETGGGHGRSIGVIGESPTPRAVVPTSSSDEQKFSNAVRQLLSHVPEVIVECHAA
jgi:hypothetical protein